MAARWRDKYNLEEREFLSDATALDCSDSQDMTVQSDKDDADINVIMERFGRTGHMPPARDIPMWGDFSGLSDFQGTIEQLRAAQDAFDTLPSNIRSRFSNDPGQLLEFIHNDANYGEAVQIGLIPPKEAPPPAPPPTP